MPRKKSLDVSVSSDERKREHGNTAPYGPAAWGKTHIGGNFLGTCTQGSTSPPANGLRSPGIRRPTIHLACPVNGHHRPVAQWTRRHIWQTGHARPPGMPSHRPSLTKHSLTTGKVGDIETSSLPITGHRPSSHWSSNLERLNLGEIQESPTTGHDRSPGSWPPVTGHQDIIQPTTNESHTFGTEFTSKQSSTSRILLRLEPDFSNMSNPSVVIEPPGNNWRSDNNNDNYRQIHQTSLSGRRSRRDQSRDRHTCRSKKRRRLRLASTASSSTYTSSHLQTLARK